MKPWRVEAGRTPLGDSGDYEHWEQLVNPDGVPVATRFDPEDDAFEEIAKVMTQASQVPAVEPNPEVEAVLGHAYQACRYHFDRCTCVFRAIEVLKNEVTRLRAKLKRPWQAAWWRQ